MTAMLRSFFLAGFECATGYNVHGRWFDQVVATQHDRFADEDYARLRAIGIHAAREGVRWPLVDRAGRYDFSTVVPFLAASRRHGIDVVWDLFHFGYPDDADPFAPGFSSRFAEYCHAVARFVGAETAGVPWFTPVNEPSYFAWAGGEVGLFAPHARGRGPELKRAVAAAAIRGIDAIRAACPAARIVNVDALCRVVPPRDRPELAAEADAFNDGAVFESWDVLCGRRLPELGGSRAHLDVPGINYYWTNQWELGLAGIPLAEDDPRCWSLGRLVRTVWNRYGGDVLITETSHVDEMRGPWVRDLADQAEALLDDGVPLRGICLYPILGMPEWHAPEQWTHMGLWDLVPQSPTLGRVPYEPMLSALREAQRLERRAGRRP
ncbi:MAG TPA: glycoside hydrolase [Candidatus Binatia bacterium]|nr:glycoside hydrolase [Candidatus Binatia bacterium]